MKIYSADFLRMVATDIFVACGAPIGDAGIVADHLVANDLRGLDSHGVVRIPEYYKWIQQGIIKPGGAISVLTEQDTTAVIDCGFNFGQVGALRRSGRSAGNQSDLLRRAWRRLSDCCGHIREHGL